MPRIGFMSDSLLTPVGGVDVMEIAGVPPQIDDTDKLAVSLYGDGTVPGDSALRMESAAQRNLRIGVYGAGTQATVGVAAFADEHPQGGVLNTLPFTMDYNGVTWDRHRNNWTSVVLASAARGASVNSDDQVNYNQPHLLLTVNITVQTAAETIQLAVELIDPISGAYSNVWTAAAAIGAVGTYTYLLGPAAVAAVYTENIHIVMPRDWRLVVTQVGVGPITYSVAVSYIGH